MLSKKMTFSLMSLITIIALAFSISPAMADLAKDHPTGLAHGALAVGHAHFSTTLSYDEAENVDGRQVDVTIEFGKVVSLAAVRGVVGPVAAAVDDGIAVIIVNDDFTSKAYLVTGEEAVVTTDQIIPMIGADHGFGPVIQKDIDLSTALVTNTMV